MHPLQRRSLFAILTIAESAIQQMKSILAQEPDAEGVPKAARPPQPSIGEKEYLTESEEEAFERLLEDDRQKMVEADKARMANLWGEEP